MKDRAEQSLEQKLFEMAEREEMILPDTLQDRMDDILVRLTKRRKYRMTWRKSVVLAAALTAMLSITVTAAVSVLQQRMEAMNEKEMEEYFVQIYRNAIGVDNYNRPYTESEKERMEQLRKSYEETGLFPKGALTMISEPEAYRGKGVAFYGDTATFFFPEKEMSDEELLGRHGDLGTFIIRVQHRQNSSWQGRITWMDRDKTVYFRSMWEMLKLVDSALDTVSGQNEDMEGPSWPDGD